MLNYTISCVSVCDKEEIRNRAIDGGCIRRSEEEEEELRVGRSLSLGKLQLKLMSVTPPFVCVNNNEFIGIQADRQTGWWSKKSPWLANNSCEVGLSPRTTPN